MNAPVNFGKSWWIKEPYVPLKQIDTLFKEHPNRVNWDNFMRYYAPGGASEKAVNAFREVIEPLEKETSNRQIYIQNNNSYGVMFSYGRSLIHPRLLTEGLYTKNYIVDIMGPLTFFGDQIKFNLADYPSCCGLTILHGFRMPPKSNLTQEQIVLCLKDAYVHYYAYEGLHLRSRRIQAVFVQPPIRDLSSISGYADQEKLKKFFNPTKVTYSEFAEAFISMLTDVTYSYHINKNTQNMCTTITGTIKEEYFTK